MKPTFPVLTLAAALSACGDGHGLGPQHGALRLDVTVARSVIGVGDTTSAVVTLRNLSAHFITVTFSSSCQILPYISAQPGDTIVYPRGGEWVCLTVITELVLAPRAERREVLLIRGGTATEGGSHAIALERGQYLIHATLASGEPPVRADPVLLTVQ